MSVTPKSKGKDNVKTATSSGGTGGDCPGNICDDQNGIITCFGGHPVTVPFPITGGPFHLIVDIDPATSLPRLGFAPITPENGGVQSVPFFPSIKPKINPPDSIG